MKKFIQTVKKFAKKGCFALLAAFGLAVPAMAEGAGSGTAYNTADAVTFASNFSATISDYWSNVSTYVYSILGVAVLVMLVFVGWKLMSKGTKKVG